MIISYYYRILIFSSFFLFVSPVFSLSMVQRSFLDHLKVSGYGDEPIYSLPILDKEMGSPDYNAFKESSNKAKKSYTAAVSALKQHALTIKDFNVLHTECGLGFGVGYFNTLGAVSTCLNRDRYLDKVVQQIPEVFSSQQNAKYRNLSVEKQLAEVTDNYYFHYDLVILDKLLESWILSDSLVRVRRNLQLVALNTPFVLLRLPKKSPSTVNDVTLKTALKNPHQFFQEIPFLKIIDIPEAETEKHKFYLCVMQGTEVKGNVYAGELKSYRAYWNRINWIGDHVVIKQYHRHTNGNFTDLEQFQNTLSFYEKGHAYGFTFMPKMHAVQIKDDRVLFVAQKEGRDLRKMTEWMPAHLMKQTLGQVLDILWNLEKKTMTNGDLWAANFVINAREKVFLIDYDQAKFTKGPTLNDVIKIALTGAGGSVLEFNEKKMVGGLKRFPLSYFGPLKDYVKPIYDGKVSTIAELRLLMGKA